MNKAMKKIISVVIMLVFSAGVIFAGSRVPAEIPVVKDETANTTPAPAPVDLESVSIEGMNAEAYQVTEVGVDADGNYYVFAHGTGYNESVDIELRVACDDNHNSLNVAVMNQAETNGLGTKIAEADFLSKFEGISLPVSLGGLKPKNPVAPKEEAAPVETETATYVDGTYTAEAAEFHNGYKDVVTVVVEGGKIVSVDYNCLTEDGGTKRAQSENGEYVMTEDGPLWHEQADAFAQYVVENQGTVGLNLNDNGKTDVVAGVSIAISGAEALVNECLEQAQGGAKYADGTYTVEGADFHNGYKDVVTVVVEGGKIVSVDYNCLNENGGTKREESQNGAYVMTEDGPLWHEQAEAFAQYVVAHQGTAGLNLNDNGKTDVVAGVSIAISGAESLVNEAIAQAQAAAGTVVETPEVEAPAETPAEDVAATTIDAISNATVSSKAFGKIVNNAYYFMKDNFWK